MALAASTSARSAAPRACADALRRGVVAAPRAAAAKGHAPLSLHLSAPDRALAAACEGGAHSDEAALAAAAEAAIKAGANVETHGVNKASAARGRRVWPPGRGAGTAPRRWATPPAAVVAHSLPRQLYSGASHRSASLRCAATRASCGCARKPSSSSSVVPLRSTHSTRPPPQLLLKAGANVKTADSIGHTCVSGGGARKKGEAAFFVGCWRRRLTTLPHFRSPPPPHTHPTHSPLVFAVMNGHQDVVDLLIAEGADVLCVARAGRLLERARDPRRGLTRGTARAACAISTTCCRRTGRLARTGPRRSRSRRRCARRPPLGGVATRLACSCTRPRERGGAGRTAGRTEGRRTMMERRGNEQATAAGGLQVSRAPSRPGRPQVSQVSRGARTRERKINACEQRHGAGV